MWEFFTELFKAYGLFALIPALEAALIVYLLWQDRLNRKIIELKDEKIENLANKRLDDVKESKEDYEDLLRDMNRSLDTLIKVVNKG